MQQIQQENCQEACTGKMLDDYEYVTRKKKGNTKKDFLLEILGFDAIEVSAKFSCCRPYTV